MGEDARVGFTLIGTWAEVGRYYKYFYHGKVFNICTWVEDARVGFALIGTQ